MPRWARIISLFLALSTKLRSATNGNYALGNPKFQEQMEEVLGRRVTRGKAGRPRKEGD